MPRVRKFRDMPEWQDFRRWLREEFHLDPNLNADFGEIEGDSLDFVEVTMAMEEAFEKRFKVGR
jgi:acyl carrier protein